MSTNDWLALLALIGFVAIWLFVLPRMGLG